MHVLVTGAAGHLACPLLPVLFMQPYINKVSGIDVKASGIQHPKYTEFHTDIRSTKLADNLRDVDCVVHLAFAVLPRDAQGRRITRAEMADINVNGSRRLLFACREAGVKKLIYLSSAAVYGSHSDNPLFMQESQALRPMQGFAYAEDKVAVEHMLDDTDTEGYPIVIRLRSHVILGPHCQPLLRAILSQPFYPRLQPEPLLQCVWEDDVVQAILLGLSCEHSGTYNLAAAEPLSLHAMLALRFRLTLPAPMAAISLLHSLAWRFSPNVGEPAWVKALHHNLTVSIENAKHDLGWQPRYTTRQCIQQL